MSTTPRLDALLLLDAYQAALQEGNSDFKAALWSLTKARREKSDIAASNVRQEFESVLRVEHADANDGEEEPDLKQEPFSLVDVAQKQQQEKENLASTNTTVVASNNTTAPKDNASIGLRNRHSKTDYTSSSKSEEKPSMTQEDAANDVLVVPNSLQLLGGALPPRSLHAAQAQAKQALESYIRAANLIQELRNIMKEKE